MHGCHVFRLHPRVALVARAYLPGSARYFLHLPTQRADLRPLLLVGGGEDHAQRMARRIDGNGGLTTLALEAVAQQAVHVGAGGALVGDVGFGAGLSLIKLQVNAVETRRIASVVAVARLGVQDQALLHRRVLLHVQRVQGWLVVLGDARFVEGAVRAPRLGLVRAGQQHTQALFAAVAAAEGEVGYLEALE